MGICIASIRYILYFRDIRRGAAKPHVFSWFVWGILAGIAAAAQFAKGAGPGAWITGLVAASCLMISFIALFRGENGITRSDWICLIAALLAVALWTATESPLLAVMIVVGADGLGYFPTFRKTYSDPWSEPPSGWALATLRSALGILALESINLTTLLYPAIMLLLDGGLTVMVLVRRRQLRGRDS